MGSAAPAYHSAGSSMFSEAVALLVIRQPALLREVAVAVV